MKEVTDRVTYAAHGWHFTCAPCREPVRAGQAFIAMARREPFPHFDWVRLPGDLWFEYGSTAAEALQKLTEEVASGAAGSA